MRHGALAAFAARNDEAYEPHLSLAYADADEASFATLRDVADRSGVNGLGFNVDALELWRTEGFVADWRLAGVFPIKREAPS